MFKKILLAAALVAGGAILMLHNPRPAIRTAAPMVIMDTMGITAITATEPRVL